MSSFVLQKKKKEVKQEEEVKEEVDEEELLATLSSEELQELERELAVLDDNIPIGLRQKDQTGKTPTGTFDRDALLRYWEEENRKVMKEEEEEEEEEENKNVTKEEEEEEERREDKTGQDGRSDKSRAVTSSDGGGDRKKVPQKGKKPMGFSGKNNVKKDEEVEKKDECKKEARKCPSKVTRRTETPEKSPKTTPERESGNPILVDETLEKILSDDPAVSEVNLNNIEDVSQETLLRFAEALRTNTHVHVFSLANTRADDRVAFAVSKMLRENGHIRNLNIESNFVSGQGILAVLAALKDNRTLVELRFHNQRHICGGKVEMEMVQLLRENTTLLKLGYQFDLPGPRMTATGILTRNQDQERQRRMQQKRKEQQSPAEGSAKKPTTQPERSVRKPTQPAKTENQKKKTPPAPPSAPPPPPPPQSLDPPTRKIAEMVKQHETSNSKTPREDKRFPDDGPAHKPPSNQRKPTRSKKLKNGANEKESADILKELKNSLRPSPQKRRAEGSRPPPPPPRSSRDDLMAAIRGSSISSLKRVDQSKA